MSFFSSSATGALILWCRALKHGLGGGLSLVRIFELQAKKGPQSLRPMADRLAARLKEGDTLEDALDAETDRLPKLFCQLATIGERTGHLPEVFAELADYYEMQQSLRRDFVSQITWPVFQFFAAVFVIAGLIYILGIVSAGGEAEPIAPIGFGLTGTSGAITFLIAIAVFLVPWAAFIT